MSVDEVGEEVDELEKGSFVEGSKGVVSVSWSVLVDEVGEEVDELGEGSFVKGSKGMVSVSVFMAAERDSAACAVIDRMLCMAFWMLSRMDWLSGN